MKLYIATILSGFLLFTMSCKNQDRQNSKTNKIKKLKQEIVKKSSETDTKKNQKKGTLLFFLNPNGRPCQIQDKILNDLKHEISKKLEIQYIKTTNPDDRQSFYDYSVRALPSLVIIDSNLKVVKRFTPGIKRKTDIMNAIKSL